MPVPPGVPAGYLWPDELQQVCALICDLPIDVDEWAALKMAILKAWPRDPWSTQWDESSGHADGDDLSSEGIAP